MAPKLLSRKQHFTAFILTALLISSFSAHAQAPDAYFKDTYGGSANDAATAIQQTTDGGYIMAGRTYSSDYDVTYNHGVNDVWVVKLDEGGRIVWQKTYGANDDDEATSIQQTKDGGYIVAGFTYSSSLISYGASDYYVLKLDDTGGVEWQKTYGGTSDDKATAVRQTTDGGYIVVGWTQSNDGDVTGSHVSGIPHRADYWVIKLNNAGTLVWQKALGGSNTDSATSVQQCIDGGYIVAGYSRSNDGDVTGAHGAGDYWIVKLTSSGSIDWEKTLGGSDNDIANDIKQTSDTGYIIAGTTASSDGDVTLRHTTPTTTDYWVVKLDKTGGLTWQKTFGSFASDAASSVMQDYDGNYVVGGNITTSNGDVKVAYGFEDFWVIKINDTGSILWQKTLGGSSTDELAMVAPTADSGYIMAGFTYSYDVDIRWLHGGSDCFAVKLKRDHLAVPVTSFYSQVSVYPTLTNGYVNVILPQNAGITEVSMLNILGQQVLSLPANSQSRLSMDLNGRPPGLYILQVRSGNMVHNYKIIYQP